MKKLMELLGMPKNTKSFIIRGNLEEALEVSLEYYPEDKQAVKDLDDFKT